MCVCVCLEHRHCCRVSCVGVGVQVPLEELDLRRLREAAEEMREQLGLTSKAVRGRHVPTRQVAVAGAVQCQANATWPCMSAVVWGCMIAVVCVLKLRVQVVFNLFLACCGWDP